jgi:hypothetical protein
VSNISKFKGPATLAAPLLVSLAIAACGGSSTSTTTTGETSTSTSTSPTTTATTQASQPTQTSQQSFAAYRLALSNYAACMRRHGVDLAPPRTSASGLPVLGSPKNVSNTSPQFSAALLHCREYIVKITKVSPTGGLGQ